MRFVRAVVRIGAIRKQHLLRPIAPGITRNVIMPSEGVMDCGPWDEPAQRPQKTAKVARTKDGSPSSLARTVPPHASSLCV